MGNALVYTLRGDAIDIILAVEPGGAVGQLSYRADDAEPREFSGDEISSAATPEGIRLTVVLEDGAADGPIVRFSVLVPTVETWHEGPFDVSAASVRTTQRSGFGGVHAGPQQSFEAMTLLGTAEMDSNFGEDAGDDGVVVAADEYGDGEGDAEAAGEDEPEDGGDEHGESEDAGEAEESEDAEPEDEGGDEGEHEESEDTGEDAEPEDAEEDEDGESEDAGEEPDSKDDADGESEDDGDGESEDDEEGESEDDGELEPGDGEPEEAEREEGDPEEAEPEEAEPEEAEPEEAAGDADAEPAPPEDDRVVGECRDWTAVYDEEPPGPSKLVVTGTCTVATPGHRIELRRSEPQGINPYILLLDKVVIAPDGGEPDVVTDVEIRYEDVTEFQYDKVTIQPDGPTVDVIYAE